MSRLQITSRGPFFADQIGPGDPYELSNGHAVYTMGTGGRGSRANLVGGSVLDSDPAVEEAGVNTGFSPDPQTLRAPDVSVGNVPDEPLYDRATAHEVTLRNLLQRRGYEDLDDVRAEALRDALLGVLEARGLVLDAAARALVDKNRELTTLQRWLARAATAQDPGQVFGD